MMEEGWRTASESIALELRMPFRMGKAFLLILALEGTNSNRGTYLELGANLTIITFLFTFFFCESLFTTLVCLHTQQQ